MFISILVACSMFLVATALLLARWRRRARLLANGLLDGKFGAEANGMFAEAIAGAVATISLHTGSPGAGGVHKLRGCPPLPVRGAVDEQAPNVVNIVGVGAYLADPAHGKATHVALWSRDGLLLADGKLGEAPPKYSLRWDVLQLVIGGS